MRSNVVFGSLYLDRWLKSGWYLDIVMLLLLGVAPLMCRTDSVVFGLPGSWVWRWLTWCHLIFFTYHTSGATLQHIPFHLEVHGSSQTCTIITYWMLTETWTWSLPYRASEIHPARSALLYTWMPSCLSIWEVHLGYVCMIQLWIQTTIVTCSMTNDFMTLVLLTCHTSDAILGHISVSDEIYGSSWRS